MTDEPVSTERCPDPGCPGEHYWQRATYRRVGWVSYRSPVRLATHPDLRYRDRPGRFHPDRLDVSRGSS